MDEKPRPILALLPFIMLILAAMACVQDCAGGSFYVRGVVTDTDGNPIANAVIRVWNNGSYERRPFNLTSTSDAAGYFETGGVFSYACTSFQVEVTAEGYEAQHFTFFPPTGEGWADELPDQIRVQFRKVTK